MRQAGFTLMEVLVALTLAGLLMLLLTGGLQVGARAWQGGEGASEGWSRIGAVQRVLRARLQGALPLPAEDPAEVAFTGTRTGFAFVRPLAPQDRPGGLQRLEVQLLDGTVWLDWRNLVDGSRRREPLLEGVAELRLAYFGSGRAGRAPGWQGDWLHQAVLPSLVRIELRFADGRLWPPFVAALPVDARPACSSLPMGCADRGRGRPG